MAHDPDEPRPVIGERLRSLRQAQGLTLSALARLAGVGKATLSRLESGGQNPTMETLYALTTVLGVPLSAVLPVPARHEYAAGPGDAGDGAQPVRFSAASPATAYLLDVMHGPDATTETYRLTITAGPAFIAAPHAPGLVEHVIVVDGVITAGPVGATTVLRPGESCAWTADVPHIWACEGEIARAVLVVTHQVS